jgi:heptosyltransferase II
VTGKTIVYLPNWVGDMVMATPMLRSLRDGLEGELWAVGKPTAMRLYNGLDLFDRFVPYGGKGIIKFLDTVSSLKGGGFGRGIVLPHSFRSALLFRLASVRARIGYGRNHRACMLTKTIPDIPPLPAPTVEHYLRILDTLGAERVAETPHLRVTEDEERRFDDRFPDVGGSYVAFIVGAQYGPSKRWPDSYFSALADLLVERFPVRVYLLPGKGEEEVAGRVYDGIKRKERVEIRDMDIMELKVALSRAALVVSNDTGPRHIAAALSVPTIAILGSMDDRYTAYRSSNTYAISKDIPCRPCNMRRCDRDHECLKGIRPDQVFRKAEEVFVEHPIRAD